MINDVIFKSVRSDGKEMVLGGSESDWLILSDGLTGIDYPSTNLYTEKNAVGDGMYVTGKDVEGRTVTVKAGLKSVALNEVARRVVLSFFNSKYTFRNYVKYMGVTRWIDAELDGFSCPSKNIYKPLTLSATYFSPNPFWRSMDDFGKDIASTTGTWGFPYIETSKALQPNDDIVEIKPKPSIFNFAKRVPLENNGDVETFCTVVMQASGEVVNPQISKNDKFVKLLDTLKAGDVVVIDFAKNTIYKNGVNVISKVDKGSSFTAMGFEVGDNEIGFDAESGDNELSVTLYYNELYGGL